MSSLNDTEISPVSVIYLIISTILCIVVMVVSHSGFKGIVDILSNIVSNFNVNMSMSEITQINEDKYQEIFFFLSLIQTTYISRLVRKLIEDASIVDNILMFLGNNPQYQTARDIVKIRNIKANLISINVEKLVKEGYLRREEIKGDRRKTKLIITEKAHPVIKEGQQLQQGFVDQLFDNTTQEDKKIFIHVMKNMDKNLDDILKGGN